LEPYFYQYILGSLVFVVGMIYAWKGGYVSTSGKGLKNALIAFGGLALFAGLQGYLEYGDMTEAEPCAYPCVERFDERPREELDRIESILNVDQDLASVDSAEEAGELTSAEAEESRTEISARRKLGTSLDYGIMIGYFVVMLAIGTWFGRNQRDTKDFFFGGQRFSWWLISFSLVATTVGSYSFVKYSKIAFGYGIASSQTYLNDWFWMPLLVFGWLPILYFSRVVSIPEYFERRFGPEARRTATWILLIYLIGYVGINLFTMGKALHHLIGWDVFYAALLVGTISATYVTVGGQTSVIMTDLFQGAMLLATGLVLLWLGMDYLGGPTEFWENLPRGHRQAFVGFNDNPSYHSVGIFWQDFAANSAMFYFLNQGMVMRLMAARSIKDSRKSVISMFLLLMPIAAIVVASGGWVGKALVHSGAVPSDMVAERAFYDTAYILTQPGVFGLIMAALTAALMSTVDTLVTAVSAIAVNDIYKPKHPKATEAQLLSVARIASVSVMAFGIALVPLFNQFDSIYSAHGAFTAAVTPPLVVTLLLGVFWRKFSDRAAQLTMTIGAAAILFSLFVPEIIAPFAHGVTPRDAGEGILGGMDQYKFMRAFFGLGVCFVVAIVANQFTKPPSMDKIKGLVWGTVSDAIEHYKGSKGTESEGEWCSGHIRAGGDETFGGGDGTTPIVTLSNTLAKQLGVVTGDLLYVTDSRSWLGGLRASHAVVGSLEDSSESYLVAGESFVSRVVAQGREGAMFSVRSLLG